MPRRACWLGLTALALFACRGEAPRARVGIALEASWYAAVRMAQADLGDLPMDLVGDSTRNVQMTASALEYANWMADQGVAVVIGHSASRGSVAASAIYAERGITEVAPMATSGELTRAAGVFSLVPSDSSEGAFIAAFLDTALHARRPALLYHNDEYGLGLRDGIVAELTRRKLDVVDERFLAPGGDSGVALRVEPLLAAALKSRPDVFVLAARVQETRDAAAYLRGLRLTMPLVSGDGGYVLPATREWRRLSFMEGAYVVRFWGPDRDSASAEFARRFEARVGYPPDQAEAAVYDAVTLVGTAVGRGARTAQDFRRFLDGLGRERPPQRGLLGAYQFQRGRPVGGVMEMAVVRQGQLVVTRGGHGR